MHTLKKKKTLCIVVDSHSNNKNIVRETKQSVINRLIHLLSKFAFFVKKRVEEGASFMLYELAVCCMLICM